MALFERPSPDHVFTLLRLGFAARLRWELSDTFLHSTPPLLTPTPTRSSATIFHFLSNESPPLSSTAAPLPWASRTLLVAVLARPTPSDDTAFLSLSDASPCLSDAPGVLKLSFPRGVAHPSRALVALQSPGPAGQFLSLASAASKSAVLALAVSKRELFHLEIIPGSLGKGFTAPAPGPTPYISTAQALSYALLELGVRFRLRSAHGRVLRKAKEAKGVVAVVQDGPRTRLTENNERELLMCAFKVEGGGFVMQDVEGGKTLSIGKKFQGVESSKSAEETAALLTEVDAAGEVQVRCSESRWGVVNVGKVDGRKEEWLMAGRRGRLEVRSHRSSWETFQIEFVRQSFSMAMKELAESAVYNVANEATRAAVREKVAAKVAKLQGKKPAVTASGVPTPMKKVTFDHSAALGGISAEAEFESSTNSKLLLKSHDESSSSGQKAEAEPSSKAQGKASGKRGGAMGAAVATSTLPRNQANKKAAKKSKRQRQRAKNRPQAAAKANPPVKRPETKKAEENSKVLQAPAEKDGSKTSAGTEETEKVTSTSSQKTSGGSGPPCAACGRNVEGNYTTALGKNFHPQCFCCGRCRRPMGVGAGQFRERGGIPYCQTCYAAHLAARCARCSKPIMDTVTTAMDKTWHKECLTCSVCRLPLTQTFWLYADKPNEPRCSRCVTGSEDAGGMRHRGTGRMVNLPGFGPRNSNPSTPVSGAGTSNVAAGQGQGRARLMAPVMPAVPRR